MIRFNYLNIAWELILKFLLTGLVSLDKLSSPRKRFDISVYSSQKCLLMNQNLHVNMLGARKKSENKNTTTNILLDINLCRFNIVLPMDTW